MTIHRYQGHIGAALILGGIDVNGPHLFSIHPHGSTDKLPYVTMGSGSLNAMAVFEARYKLNMDVSTQTMLCCNAGVADSLRELIATLSIGSKNSAI